MCDKVTYTDRDAAAAAIKGLQKDKHTRHSNRFPSTTYFCEDCNGWHIASQQRSKKRKPFIGKPEMNSRAKMSKKGRKKVELLHIKDLTHARFQSGAGA